LLLSGVGNESRYLTGMLPGVMLFGLGLATLVAPLTAAVLGAVPEAQAGLGSAINNAVARLAGLLGTTALPLIAGLGRLSELRGDALAAGVGVAMRWSAGLCLLGAVTTVLTVRTPARARARG